MPSSPFQQALLQVVLRLKFENYLPGSGEGLACSAKLTAAGFITDSIRDLGERVASSLLGTHRQGCRPWTGGISSSPFPTGGQARCVQV